MRRRWLESIRRFALTLTVWPASGLPAVSRTTTSTRFWPLEEAQSATLMLMATAAGLVERHGLLVEDQGFVLAAIVQGEGGAGFVIEIDLETIGVVMLVLRPARAQGCGNL